jgi:hypothetical protein
LLIKGFPFIIAILINLSSTNFKSSIFSFLKGIRAVSYSLFKILFSLRMSWIYKFLTFFLALLQGVLSAFNFYVNIKEILYLNKEYWLYNNCLDYYN